MSAAIINLLARLEDVHEGRDGEYRARCPAHGSRARSLALTTGRNGQVLVHCHAGCDVEQVVDAVGLRVTDLFPDAGADRARSPRSGPRIDYRLACRALLHDQDVIEVAASDLVNGKTLNAEDGARFLNALERVAALRRALRA